MKHLNKQTQKLLGDELGEMLNIMENLTKKNKMFARAIAGMTIAVVILYLAMIYILTKNNIIVY